MKKSIEKLPYNQLIDTLERSPFLLNQTNAKVDLARIFEGWFHNDLKATVIGNLGVKLLIVSPLSGKRSIIEHTGFSVNIPDHGIEIVNVAVYGSLKQASSLIVRAESACPPSFLFGSQRCNCWDQWATTRELAARYHQITLPNMESGEQLEEYITNYKPDAQLPALILIYLDSQSGMGSGALNNTYNQTIGETAFMRHRGEYTAEQLLHVSMAEAFKSIGIEPDPRSSNNGLGYKISGVILDCMRARQDIHFLTNNPLKEEALTKMGYSVIRHEIYGRLDIACEIETRDRVEEFGHQISFKGEINPVEEAANLMERIEKKGVKRCR